MTTEDTELLARVRTQVPQAKPAMKNAVMCTQQNIHELATAISEKMAAGWLPQGSPVYDPILKNWNMLLIKPSAT